MAFSTNPIEYGFGNDPVVIRKHVDDLKGGVALDTTGYTEEFIKAGHVVIKKTEEGKDIYKPMPVSEGAYGSLGDCTYVGVVVATVPTDEPFVSVLTIGEVNDKLTPYPMDSIMSAFKAAVPTIVWSHD